MGLSELLVHRADIEEPVRGLDRFGQPLRGYRTRYTGIPCRLSAPRGQGEVYTDRSRGVIKATHTLYFPADTDVGERYRIASVTDCGGVVLAENLEVLLVRRADGRDGRAHHLEVPCYLFREQEGELG